jgi:hypothetical protein
MSIKPVFISEGVYQLGKQIGTRDLPAFIKEFGYRRIRQNNKQRFMLNNMNTQSKPRLSWREQLAMVNKQLSAA